MEFRLGVRSTVLAIILLLCGLSFGFNEKASANETLTSGDYQYYISNNVVNISGYIGSDTVLRIPEEINGKSIGDIEKMAFYDKKITQVIFPQSMKMILNYSFMKNKLTSVTIPGSVSLIGSSAFADNLITNVTFEEGFKIIGNDAFKNNFLTEVTIPSSVTMVWDEAFSNNPIKRITFLGKRTVIDPKLFKNIPEDLTIVGCYDSTAKAYADANNLNFELNVEPCLSAPKDTPKGTGAIEVSVFKHDKKTAISDALQVKITDKSGRVVTGANDKLANGVFTSSETLVAGTYYVTVSDGTTDLTTEVKVSNKKASAKLYWESSLEGLKDENGTVKKSGAVRGVVYDGPGNEAKPVSGATVKIISKIGTWSTKTNKNGIFNVYVPTGTYDIVVEGYGDGKKNVIYPKIKATGGVAISPLEQLNAGVAWNTDDKTLGFSVNADSVTGTSKAFTGTGLASSTVSVYTVSGDAATWVAETKLKKDGDFSLKVPVLAGKKVIFTVEDAAGNKHFSKLMDVSKIDAPALSASVSKGAAAGTAKIKVKNDVGNKILVIVSKQATTTPKLSDAAPTTSDSAILFLTNYEANQEITVGDGTHAAVYEVNPTGEVVRFKDLPLAGKVK